MQSFVSKLHLQFLTSGLSASVLAMILFPRVYKIIASIQALKPSEACVVCLALL